LIYTSHTKTDDLGRIAENNLTLMRQSDKV